MRRRRALDHRRVGGGVLRIGASAVSLSVALAAGLLSFLSPCVLPLIPSYLGFLTGLSAEEFERRRGTALLHALWFIAGFSVIFVILGATASALGSLVGHSQVWIGRAGGVLVILFGLYLLGVPGPAWLLPERRIALARKPLGYLGSAVVGITFGAAWTPCVGPILGAILTLAAARESVSQGAVLLAAYALGLAIPFVVAALALERFLAWFQRFRPYLVWVDRVAGTLLILLGILLVTDRFTLLAGYLQGLTPKILRSRL
jgi:cytochrome c-type biogenesis protein